MSARGRQVRVALFALLGVVLVALVLILFAGARLWAGNKRYYVEFAHTVYGLEPGADVYMMGVRIGEVSSMTVATTGEPRVRVALAVDEAAPVYADSKAVLVYAGITGLLVVDLRGGSATAPRAAPGATLEPGESGLDKLQDEASSLGKRADVLFANAERIVGKLAELAESGQISSTFEELHTAAAELAETSRAVRGAIDANRGQLGEAIGSIDRAAKTLGELAGHLDQAVHGDGEQLAAALGEVRRASRSVSDLARDLRSQPSRLLFSRPRPDRRLP